MFKACTHNTLYDATCLAQCGVVETHATVLNE